MLTNYSNNTTEVVRSKCTIYKYFFRELNLVLVGEVIPGEKIKLPAVRRMQPFTIA